MKFLFSNSNKGLSFTSALAFSRGKIVTQQGMASMVSTRSNSSTILRRIKKIELDADYATRRYNTDDIRTTITKFYTTLLLNNSYYFIVECP